MPSHHNHRTLSGTPFILSRKVNPRAKNRFMVDNPMTFHQHPFSQQRGADYPLLQIGRRVCRDRVSIGQLEMSGLNITLAVLVLSL